MSLPTNLIQTVEQRRAFGEMYTDFREVRLTLDDSTIADLNGICELLYMVTGHKFTKDAAVEWCITYAALNLLERKGE